MDLSSRDIDLDTEYEEASIDFEAINWKELADVLVILVGAVSQDDDLTIAYVIGREIEEIQYLVDEDHYASALIRQSAFFEQLLAEAIKEKFEELNGRELHNAEESFIDNLGHKNRIQLAHLLNEITHRERDILLSMAKWRNKAAHNWWFVLQKTEEKQLRDAATSIQTLLNEMIDKKFEKPDEE